MDAVYTGRQFNKDLQSMSHFFWISTLNKKRFKESVQTGAERQGYCLLVIAHHRHRTNNCGPETCTSLIS